MNGDTRQIAQLHRVPGQRKGARDQRLRRNDGGHGGDDHDQVSIERVLHRLWLFKQDTIRPYDSLSSTLALEKLKFS